AAATWRSLSLLARARSATYAHDRRPRAPTPARASCKARHRSACRRWGGLLAFPKSTFRVLPLLRRAKRGIPDMQSSDHTRRQALGLLGGSVAASVLPPVSVSLGQGAVQSGRPLPPLLMESYPDQMTVEAARVYGRELAELGIPTDHKPLDF